MQKFLSGADFPGQASPTKIQPTKTCTAEKISDSDEDGYPHTRKFIPRKIEPTNIDHEISVFTIVNMVAWNISKASF